MRRLIARSILLFSFSLLALLCSGQFEKGGIALSANYAYIGAGRTVSPSFTDVLYSDRVIGGQMSYFIFHKLDVGFFLESRRNSLRFTDFYQGDFSSFMETTDGLTLGISLRKHFLICKDLYFSLDLRLSASHVESNTVRTISAIAVDSIPFVMREQLFENFNYESLNAQLGLSLSYQINEIYL